MLTSVHLLTHMIFFRVSTASVGVLSALKHTAQYLVLWKDIWTMANSFSLKADLSLDKGNFWLTKWIRSKLFVFCPCKKKTHAYEFMRPLHGFLFKASQSSFQVLTTSGISLLFVKGAEPDYRRRGSKLFPDADFESPVAVVTSCLTKWILSKNLTSLLY